MCIAEVYKKTLRLYVFGTCTHAQSVGMGWGKGGGAEIFLIFIPFCLLIDHIGYVVWYTALATR